VTFSKFDLSDAALSTSGPGTTSGDTQMLAGLADARVEVFHMGPIHPYLTVGLGAYNLKTELESGGTSESSSDTEFGINGGGGLALVFGRLSLYAQGRVDNVYTKSGGVIDKDAIQFVPVTFGLEY
jgi:opacity protein-like surface antigen